MTRKAPMAERTLLPARNGQAVYVAFTAGLRPASLSH